MRNYLTLHLYTEKRLYCWCSTWLVDLPIDRKKQGRIQDFKLGGAQLNNLRRAEQNFLGYFVWKITSMCIYVPLFVSVNNSWSVELFNLIWLVHFLSPIWPHSVFFLLLYLNYIYTPCQAPHIKRGLLQLSCFLLQINLYLFICSTKFKFS